MAALCGTWQQLALMKRERLGKGKDKATRLEDMTPSERLLWYRRNVEAVEEDRDRASYCSNYRQLQLARGSGQLHLGDAQDTRSKRLLWFRAGGCDVLEAEKELAGLCSNWQQYHLLTRNREQERDPDQEPTRAEKMLWYKNGGVQHVEEELETARNSANWIQFKLTRDTRRHVADLKQAVQERYSDFRTKEELSDYIFSLRREGKEERDEIRHHSRNRSIRESVTKEAYNCHIQPFEACELEEASLRSRASVRRISELEESLRLTTEAMLTMRTQYMESAHDLAIRAIREDEEARAASRTKKRTVVVEGQQAVSQEVSVAA